MGLKRWLAGRVTAWLTHEHGEQSDLPLSDFDRLSFEIRAGDVLLVEGSSRVSNIIKTITQSAWTHSALYLGRLRDIEDPDLQARVRRYFNGDDHEQLVIEPLLGEGTVIKPLSKYRDFHLRICRPKGLSHRDAQQVLAAALVHLGGEYDFRQMLDLARFMLPFGILPRRWRSTLFNYNTGEQSKTVCSTMIAEAFASVHFPVLPVVHREADGRLKLYKRNPRLYTPSDFDYSPYFEIIKYPLLGGDDLALYRQLPWDQEGVVCNAKGDCYIPESQADGDSGSDERGKVVENVGLKLEQSFQNKV